MIRPRTFEVEILPAARLGAEPGRRLRVLPKAGFGIVAAALPPGAQRSRMGLSALKNDHTHSNLG